MKWQSIESYMLAFSGTILGISLAIPTNPVTISTPIPVIQAAPTPIPFVAGSFHSVFDAATTEESIPVTISGCLGAGTWQGYHMIPDGPAQILGPNIPLVGLGNVRMVPLYRPYLVSLSDGQTIVGVQITRNLCFDYGSSSYYFLWTMTCAIGDKTVYVPGGGAYVNVPKPLHGVTQPDGSVVLTVTAPLIGNPIYGGGQNIKVEIKL